MSFFQTAAESLQCCSTATFRAWKWKGSRICSAALEIFQPKKRQNGWFLRFFTCVSWGISPAQTLLIVQTTAICHSIFYSSSFSMFLQSRTSKSVVICFFCSCLFFSLLYLFHPTLFYYSFYSLFCFLPLFIHFISWFTLLFSFQIGYPFFSLSNYSVLSASPLSSVPIQSVLFLLVVILLDPSI